MNRLLFSALLVGASISIPATLLIAQPKNPSSNPQPEPSTPRIEWNAATLSLIQSNGYYGRIIRLKNGQLLCGFDVDGKITVRHSNDDGNTWQNPTKVAESVPARLTNTELLQLHDGTVLCFYNERPRRQRASTNQTEGAALKTPRYAIAMTRSADDGQTWGKPEILFQAGTEFTNGCWEPAAIELPSGEVQLFFSNEGNYRRSDEQEILLLRSSDGARTWKAPEKVSFRPGHRDGMPVPLVLKDGSGILFSIEDNGLSGNFKPVIVSTSLKDNWRSGVREPDSTNRWSALRTLPPPHVSASAPYLRQMPSGETLLSFQRSETGELKTAYMVVCIGDARARNFDSPSQPFPITEGKAQLWNSLFIKNAITVVAVTETTLNGVHGIWSIEGRFVGK